MNQLELLLKLRKLKWTSYGLSWGKNAAQKDEYEDEGTWIWLSMACESRLLLAHCVGPRTQKTANVAKTARHLASIPLFVTDGLKFYKNALLNQYYEIIKYPPTGKRGRPTRADSRFPDADEQL